MQTLHNNLTNYAFTYILTKCIQNLYNLIREKNVSVFLCINLQSTDTIHA